MYNNIHGNLFPNKKLQKCALSAIKPPAIQQEMLLLHRDNRPAKRSQPRITNHLWVPVV